MESVSVFGQTNCVQDTQSISDNRNGFFINKFYINKETKLQNFYRFVNKKFIIIFDFFYKKSRYTLSLQVKKSQTNGGARKKQIEGGSNCKS